MKQLCAANICDLSAKRIDIYSTIIIAFAIGLATLPPDAMTSQAIALTAIVTGAMTGAFAVWLGHENDLYSLRSSSLKDVD